MFNVQFGYEPQLSEYVGWFQRTSMASDVVSLMMLLGQVNSTGASLSLKVKKKKKTWIVHLFHLFHFVQSICLSFSRDSPARTTSENIFKINTTWHDRKFFNKQVKAIFFTIKGTLREVREIYKNHRSAKLDYFRN